MATIPGTKAQAVFYSYSGANPTQIYYDSTYRKLNLASVNAGNSDGLAVGLGGVNLQFLADLSAAGQKNASLSPPKDDYQDRHQTLVAKAKGGTAWESYQKSDPCAFSYVQASQVSTHAGYWEGVCFVDVFDAKLCPAGNPKNAAMLYVAPPFDGNYFTGAAHRTADQAAFVAAIEATAVNIIRTVAGYNALAAQNGLPAIQTLRNTLFSSNLYNRTLNVPTDDIARAIFRGFASELQKQPHCGLVELQFPVGTGSQAPLFAAVQADLLQPPSGRPKRVGTPLPRRKPVRGRAVANFVEAGVPEKVDARRFEDPLRIVEFDANDFPVSRITVEGVHVDDAFTTLSKDTKSLVDAILNQQRIPSDPKYQILPRPAAGAGISESLSATVDGTISRVYQALPADALAASNARQAPLVDRPGDSTDVRNAKRAARSAEIVRDMASFTLNLGRSQMGMSLDNVRLMRDSALKAASEAITASKAVNDPALAGYAREVAKTAGRLAKALDVAVKQRSAVYRVFIDPKGNLRVGYKVGMGLGLAAAVGGVLTWIFVLGGGRRLVASGLGKFVVSDITKLSDGTSLITFYVLDDNGIDAGLVESIQLIDVVGSTNRLQTLTDLNGTWQVQGITVTFQPFLKAPVRDVSDVAYVLEGVSEALGWNQRPGGTTVESNSAILMVQFPPVGLAPAITIAALDRTSVVTFTIPAGATLPNPSDPDGTWVLDTMKNTAKFKPLVGTAVPSGKVTTSTTYQLSTGTPPSNQGPLTILWPASDLAFTADRSGNINGSAALPEELTFLDASGQPTDTWTDKAQGSASIPAGQLQFIPAGASVPLTTTSISIPFRTQVSVTLSTNVAHIILIFPAADIVVAAQSNSQGTMIRVPLLTRIAAPDPKTGLQTVTNSDGVWSMDPIFAPTEVTFMPTLVPPAMGGAVSFQASLPYNLVAQGVASTNTSARLTVLFPMPLIAQAQTDFVDQVILASLPPPGLKLYDQNGNLQSSWADPKTGTWEITNTQITFTPLTPGGVPTTTPFVMSPYALVVEGVPSVSGNMLVLYPATVGGSRTAATAIPVPSGTLFLDSTGKVLRDTNGDPATSVADSANNATWTLASNILTYTPTGTGVPAATTTTVISYAVTDTNGSRAAASTLTLDFTGKVHMMIFPAHHAQAAKAQRPVRALQVAAPAAPAPAAIAAANPPTLPPPVNSMMPRASDILMSSGILAGDSIAVSLLANCWSYFPRDPKSVKITGLAATGQGNMDIQSVLAITGKSLAVPGEGIWAVDDSGQIAFQADANLTGAPTAIRYQFADVNGNLSNQAVLMIDPSLGAVDDVLSSFANLYDDTATDPYGTFWDNFIGQTSPADGDDFITMTTLLAAVLQAVVAPGPEPVDIDGFEAAFETWYAAGQPPQPSDPAGVFALTKNLVEQALKGDTTKWRMVYWRLTLMARMAAQALPAHGN